MQFTSPISSEDLMQSRLGELGLQSIDVGGTGDCFFRSVSHQLYVIYQTRETVFHRDIQTPRRELKIRRSAEYF